MNKYVVALLSVMLLIGLSTTGMAAPIVDPVGDRFVAGKDILSADALFYPASSLPIADYVKLTVTMASGSTLPGMITWDFDADKNTATGGGSSLNMPFSPCPTSRCKTEGGFDFYILLVMRDQSDTGNTAYCGNCVGAAGQCVTRGATVACTEGTCYEPGDSCDIGAPGCYLLDETPCSGAGQCPNAYELQTPCTASSDCGSGQQWGEYYVGFGLGGNSRPAFRGRLELPGDILAKNQYCFTLPWGKIVAYAAMMGAVNFGDVKDDPTYQVQAWHDPIFDPNDGGDKEDFFDVGLTLNISDYVPNTGYAASTASAVEACSADITSAVAGQTDCKVALQDLVLLKAEFNRSNCPNCDCTK